MGAAASNMARIPYSIDQRPKSGVIPDPKQVKSNKDEATRYLDRHTFEGSVYKRLLDEASPLGLEPNPDQAFESFQSLLRTLAKPSPTVGQIFDNIGVQIHAVFVPPERRKELWTKEDGRSWCEPHERQSIARALGLLKQQMNEHLLKQMKHGVGPEYEAIRTQIRSLPAGERERFKAALCSATLWSATEPTSFRGSGREPCWLINLALDLDDEELLRAALPCIRCLSRFTAKNRTTMTHLSPIHLPPTNAHGKHVTFRGGGMNEECIPFFCVGKMFRFPGFIATSFSRDVARGFMEQATAREFPAVEWTFIIPDGCWHYMYLQPEFSLFGTEKEVLLAPYTCCKVVAVQWQARGDWRRTSYENPHRITLEVAKDNRLSPPGLPVAPWR